MALKKYIGARYTPKFMGAWDSQTVYAALSVVYANNQSYVSRKTVPAGTELTNTEFWLKSADWNAQVAEYNQNVEQYNQNVETYNHNVETYNTNVNTFFNDTIHAYNTQADMVNDTDIKLGYTMITTGKTQVGDKQGGYYQAVANTSATSIALKNGLFAKPFLLNDYDSIAVNKQGSANISINNSSYRLNIDLSAVEVDADKVNVLQIPYKYRLTSEADELEIYITPSSDTTAFFGILMFAIENKNSTSVTIRFSYNKIVTIESNKSIEFAVMVVQSSTEANRRLILLANT